MNVADNDIRLGGEVVAHEVGAPGFEHAGYQDIKTSDGITHGQVKQSGEFSFVRIYERYEGPRCQYFTPTDRYQWSRSTVLSASGVARDLSEGHQGSGYCHGSIPSRTFLQDCRSCEKHLSRGEFDYSIQGGQSQLNIQHRDWRAQSSRRRQCGRCSDISKVDQGSSPST